MREAGLNLMYLLLQEFAKNAEQLQLQPNASENTPEFGNGNDR